MASYRLACLSTRYNKPFSGCKVTNFLPNDNKYVLSIFRHKEYLTLFNLTPYVLQGRPPQNIPNERAKKMRTRINIKLQIPHYNSIFCHKTPLHNSIFYHETSIYNSIF